MSGFDSDIKSYNVVLPTGLNYTTDVVTSDLGAYYNVNFPYEFPGTISVDVTSSGGIFNSYYFHCNAAGIDLVNNIVVKTGSTVAVKDDLQIGDMAFTDRTYDILALSHEFKGATQITLPMDDRDSVDVVQNNSTTDYITFDIDHSAEIYIVGPCYGTWLT